MKRAHIKSFFERIRFKYKVSIINENKLEETFGIRLSRLNVFLVVGSFIIICFIINSVLIINTPLKYFLPGYETSVIRAEFIHNSLVVDSLAEKVQQQDEYINLLRRVMVGEFKSESVVSLDSLALKEREEILSKKSKREEQFVEEFERKEQFNLNNPPADVVKNSSALVFFRPVKGLLSVRYDPSKQHYGVDLLPAPNENVLAVLDGTIVFANFTVNDGYILGIQHDNDYLSIYKNNSALLKDIGTKVRAGESIAIAGNTGEKNSKPLLHFELWQKGKALNPEEYINF
ncbi:MAG: M23 family metallopeptidase [Prevotellaceae bacterium]|jgi:lipoprotein NlpD|nr:M23 family metallopeptidase [Prevotellaceae bacterium]